MHEAASLMRAAGWMEVPTSDGTLQIFFIDVEMRIFPDGNWECGIAGTAPGVKGDSLSSLRDFLVKFGLGPRDPSKP